MNRKSWHLERRTVLKGLGITCCLPFLEAMSKDAPAGKAPRRFMSFYVPNGVSLPPDHMPDLQKNWNWFPHKVGADYVASNVMEPAQHVRQDFTILGGLSHPINRGNEHSAGDAWLTGGDMGPEYRNSVSLDQVIADEFKTDTRFPYMTLSTNGGVGYRGRTTTLSFDRAGRPIPAESDVRYIFERFFQSGHQKDLKTRKRELQQKHRVVDLVLDEAKDLKRVLGAHDQAKLDEYMTTLRDLENRIEQLERWQHIPVPQFDASHIPLDVDQAASEKYLQSMVDLMILAFQIDATRVASYMIDREESKGKAQFSVYGNHHRISHGKTEKSFTNWSKFDRYLMGQFAVVIEKLKNTHDQYGPLLDSTIVYWGGANSTFHNARDYPLLLAGGHNLGFKHGRYLRFGEEVPLSNLYVSMLNALGVPNQGFADSTGPLKDVFV